MNKEIIKFFNILTVLYFAVGLYGAARIGDYNTCAKLTISMTYILYWLNPNVPDTLD